MIGDWMKNALYMDDSYQKECETVVNAVKDGKFVVLDQTIFYPNGGGQPNDTGSIFRGSEEFKVVFVGKFDGEISHEVDKPGLIEGEKVRCVLNWERRYGHMRYHTAAHIISGILHREAGVLITGNQISEDKLRIDFDLEDFDRNKVQEYVDLANSEISKNIPVKFYYLKREEALKMPGMVKLAGKMPPEVNELRIIEIEGVDISADGGTHVKNTSELGKLSIIKCENKGKSNRRLYLELKK